MNFETFKEELANSVKEQLDRNGDNYTVEINKVDKANETYDALTVKPETSNIGVNLNAGKLFEEYEKAENKHSFEMFTYFNSL